MNINREKRGVTEIVDEDRGGEGRRRLVYRSYDMEGRCEIEAAFPLDVSPEDIAAKFESKAVQLLTSKNNNLSAQAILKMVAFLKSEAEKARFTGGPFEP